MTTTPTDPAADRPLFPAMTDQRIARIRRALRTSEMQSEMLRVILDDQIAIRRAVTDPALAVCPVCGTVTDKTGWGSIVEHPGHSHRHGGGPCRGSGINVASVDALKIGGGL